jgi:hypothetical protein
MSKWTDFVKKYAKDKGITYKSAMSDPNCSIAYKQIPQQTQSTPNPQVANFIAKTFTNAISKKEPAITEMEIVRGVKNPYKKKKEPKMKKVKEPKYPPQQKTFDIDAIKKNIISYLGPKKYTSQDVKMFDKDGRDFYNTFYVAIKNLLDLPTISDISVWIMNNNFNAEDEDEDELYIEINKWPKEYKLRINSSLKLCSTLYNLLLDREKYIKTLVKPSASASASASSSASSSDDDNTFTTLEKYFRIFDFVESYEDNQSFTIGDNYGDGLDEFDDEMKQMYLVNLKNMGVDEKQAKDVACKRFENTYKKKLNW